MTQQRRDIRRITLPLSLPGVLAGFLLVFVPVTGEFVIPRLLLPALMLRSSPQRQTQRGT